MSGHHGTVETANSEPARTTILEGHLPASLTPLIGRIDEIARLGKLLTQHQPRLLVLTGPGGVGKTRLALTTAEQTSKHFADGVEFVDLSPVTSSDGVLTAIASVLGIHTANVDRLFANVREALRDIEILLVLDNFEHVIQAAPLLTRLLTTSPGLTMLVTSRSILGVYGEFIFPVPPMPVPNETNVSIEEISESDAVRLFVSRAQALQPDFRLTPADARKIVTICNRLDGLPLAIELAAARTQIFTITKLAQRLERRLPILESSQQNVPNRLRTMRNAIAWSYELLTPPEQSVFRRLSVFGGHWTLETAQQIILPGSGDQERNELFEMVGSLVDKSLILRTGTLNQDHTFQMLQTLREFAHDELEVSGDAADTTWLHAQAMLNIAEYARPNLTGRDQVSWLDELEMLYGDIRTAFEYMMDHDAPEDALRLVSAIWRFGYTRGHILETQIWLRRGLDRASDRSVIRARALNAAGVLSNMIGDMESMRRYHEEALEIGREVEDMHSMAIAWAGLGDHARLGDDIDNVEGAYQEAERLYAEVDDARGVATTRTNLANHYWGLGRVDEALALNEAARRLYESFGDQRGVAWSFTNVGRLAAERKEFHRAITNLSDAIGLYDMLGDRSGIAESLEAFALIASGTGQADVAAILFGAAARIRSEVGHPIPQQDAAAYQQLVDTTQRQLGALFENQWNAGHGMSIHEALSLALRIEAHEQEEIVRDLDEPARNQAIDKRGITGRELDVLQLLGAGQSDKEIGEHLFISVRTVQSHVKNLLHKFETNSRSAAVAQAFRDGILT